MCAQHRHKENTKGFPVLYDCQGFNTCGALLTREAPGIVCDFACECVCVHACVSIKRKVTCSMWWVIHRLVCQGAAGCLAGWLAGWWKQLGRKLISYAPPSSRLQWDSYRAQTLLLTDVWFALGCIITAFTYHMLPCYGNRPAPCDHWL